MHFDARTEMALREVGLSEADVAEAGDILVQATRDAAEALESFFEGRRRVVADMGNDDEGEDHPVLVIEYVDLYTDDADIRGYIRFDTWGAAVEGGYVIDDGQLVELDLGDPINERVRFAHEREAL